MPPFAHFSADRANTRYVALCTAFPGLVAAVVAEDPDLVTIDIGAGPSTPSLYYRIEEDLRPLDAEDRLFVVETGIAGEEGIFCSCHYLLAAQTEQDALSMALEVYEALAAPSSDIRLDAVVRDEIPVERLMPRTAMVLRGV